MDTVFFIASKLVGALVRADSWIALGLIATVWALARGRPARARLWAGATLVFVLGMGFLPLGGLLVRPLESAYPAEPALGPVDGIVILGGAEDLVATEHWGVPQVNAAAERFLAGLALARGFPAAQVVYTSGRGQLRDAFDTGRGNGVAEAIFAAQGLTGARMRYETASRNTAENARLAFELARPQPGESWVLVTSAFHMTRAMRSFERAGWTGLTAWPVDYRSRGFWTDTGWQLADNLGLFNLAAKEYLGWFAYGVTGR